MKKKLIKVSTTILFVLIFTIFLLINSVIVARDTNCKYRVGIIDTNLSFKYDNIVYSNNTNYNNGKKTHGDEIIKFLLNCQKNIDLYYFDATNEEDIIDTPKIIEGLNWMITNSVNRVNLSLSGRFSNKELETWISEHKEIEVYASYNNRINSFDFPAMYKEVFASGSSSKINYKEKDFKYNSNRIIIIKNGFKIYYGNSFLSVLSMLNN